MNPYRDVMRRTRTALRREPFGTLVLALAVTVIEGSLIVSMTFSGAVDSSTLARDTVFATVMIVCTGVIRLCLFLGSLRHHVVSFRAEGTGPTYSGSQLAFAGIVSLLAVVGLAKILSPTIEGAVDAAGVPHAVVGIAIALMVLMPETLSAVRAAQNGRLQTSMNLALGSALATIGLTIPAVVVAASVLSLPLTLGLPPTEMVLLALTLLLTAMTVSAGRATLLQGAIHLIVVAVFIFLAMVP